MELGGLRDSRERVFLLSTTHGAETHGLAAAIETMRIYREEPVIETLYARGERLRAGIEAAARTHGVEDRFEVVGRAPNLVYVARDDGGMPSQVIARCSSRRRSSGASSFPRSLLATPTPRPTSI